MGWNTLLTYISRQPPNLNPVLVSYLANLRTHFALVLSSTSSSVCVVSVVLCVHRLRDNQPAVPTLARLSDAGRGRRGGRGVAAVAVEAWHVATVEAAVFQTWKVKRNFAKTFPFNIFSDWQICPGPIQDPSQEGSSKGHDLLPNYQTIFYSSTFSFWKKTNPTPNSYVCELIINNLFLQIQCPTPGHETTS